MVYHSKLAQQILRKPGSLAAKMPCVYARIQADVPTIGRQSQSKAIRQMDIQCFVHVTSENDLLLSHPLSIPDSGPGVLDFAAPAAPSTASLLGCAGRAPFIAMKGRDESVEVLRERKVPLMGPHPTEG